MDNSSGSNGSSAGGEGEDQEDSSSSSDNIGSTALEEFRREWQKEIKSSPQHSEKYEKKTHHLEIIPHNIEDKAKQLFQLGTENEEKGKLYEAIQYYRRAVQLVPDIEFRLFQLSIQQSKTSQKVFNDEDEGVEDEYIETVDVEHEETPFDPEKMDLLSHLMYISCKQQKRVLCTPLQSSKGTHFSALPMEIFLYILRWVVSTDLDLRSLEMCSRVCRGFYICCRDPEIWKAACTRIWGVKCGQPGKQYLTWRDMLIQRPRLHFGGCYISKTTYIRPGENSFQDQYYRPWHLVEYYRYLRFFPDGRALMLTTPEEPVGCVGLLKTKLPISRQPPVFTGYYRLLDSTVSIVLTPGPEKKTTRSNSNQSYASHSFHIELEILSYRNHLHGQLVWRGYSVFTRRNGVETTTTFDLGTTRYPPFWYSRVKSYMAETTDPLSN